MKRAKLKRAKLTHVKAERANVARNRARSETEVSFKIDDLVGKAMELVPDRAGVDITRAVCASLLPVLQSMAGGMLCKCSGDAGKVKVALQ